MKSTSSPSPKRETWDTGNEGIYRHRALRPERVPGTYRARMRVVDGNELDRLLWLGLLSNTDWSTGDKLLGIAAKAKVRGLKAQNLMGVPGGGYDLTKDQAIAFQRLQDALGFVRQRCGDRGKNTLLGLVLEDIKFPSRAVPGLRRCLQVLGQFFAEERD